MTSKGIYPYEYIGNYNKLNEIQLPEQKKIIQVEIIHIAAMKIINLLDRYGINLIAIQF